MFRTVCVVALGVLLAAAIASGYFIAQRRVCTVASLARADSFSDPELALASVVSPDPEDYIVTLDYRDLRDHRHHIEYGYFVEGDLVEEVNVYEPSVGSWQVFSLESCEGPSMP